MVSAIDIWLGWVNAVLEVVKYYKLKNNRKRAIKEFERLHPVDNDL